MYDQLKRTVKEILECIEADDGIVDTVTIIFSPLSAGQIDLNLRDLPAPVEKSAYILDRIDACGTLGSTISSITMKYFVDGVLIEHCIEKASAESDDLDQ